MTDTSMSASGTGAIDRGAEPRLPSDRDPRPTARSRMLDEVLAGLSRPQKELSPKYFYDHRGSELFEAITQLPEYYLSRTEEALLDEWVPRWVAELAPRTLVELGAGSARKTRVLLDSMVQVGSGEVFVPVDVSGDFLESTVRQVRLEYPELAVEPRVADLSRPLDLPGARPAPVLFVLLGSTIGNFPDEKGVRLLEGVRSAMGPDDRLLMGADLRPSGEKTVAGLEAAYNDAAGVTAAFNRNVLRVLNARLGTDFDPVAFEHRASYVPELGRIEMHLVSTVEQVVDVGGVPISFAEGESIRTEISCKYDLATLEGLLERAGLELDRWARDQADRFSVSWVRAAA